VGYEDIWYKIDSTDVLWRNIAGEHVALYSRFKVLRIDFVENHSKTQISSTPGG